MFFDFWFLFSMQLFSADPKIFSKKKSIDGWTKVRSSASRNSWLKPNFSTILTFVKVQTKEPSAHHQSYPDNFMNEWMEMFAFKQNHSIYYDIKLLSPVVCFAELVSTGLWATWAEQYALYTQFLPISVGKELDAPKLKSN